MKRAPIGRPFFVHLAWPKVSQKNPTDSQARPSTPSPASKMEGRASESAQTKHLTKRVLLAHGDHVVASAVVIAVIITG